jgi:ComF family protein
VGLEFLAGSSLDALYAAGEFSGCLRDVVHHFKYQRRESLGEGLARQWLSRSPLRADDYDVVMPVPTTPWKSIVRGYNPAHELARTVAARHHRPISNDALRRRWTSTSQTDKNKRDRKRNAQSGYRPGRGLSKLKGLAILLVDDVCTTGATLEACARLLKRAGARRVLGAAAARDMLA